MGNTNYFSGIVKILENPSPITLLSNRNYITTFRVEVPQVRENKIITLNFWGKLAKEVIDYYQMNDYILIEGYLSLTNIKTNNFLNKTNQQVLITVLKVYPFFFKSNHNIKKI